jgi:hypothetical protein
VQLESENHEILLSIHFKAKIESITAPESGQLATISAKIPVGVKKMFSENSEKS